MSEHTGADYERDLLSRAKEIEIAVLHRKDKGVIGQLTECVAHWSNYGCSVHVSEDPFGGFISLTRNRIVYRFLRGSKKYLLMCDDDLYPITSQGLLDPSSVLRMAQRDKPVVSGCACGISPERGIFLCVVARDDAGNGRFVSMEDVDSIPMDGISPIENCGAGYIMIRRDVLETIWTKGHARREDDLIRLACELEDGRAGKEWAPFVKSLRHAYDDDGLPFTIPMSVAAESVKTGRMMRSEDICFSDRVLKAGYGLYVDWSVHLVHQKLYPIIWPQESRKDIDAAAWKVPKEALLATEV